MVASLFRNFLLAERIMRSGNCTPISHPMLPPTHQHHMWYWTLSLVCILMNCVSELFTSANSCFPGMHGTWLLKSAFLSFLNFFWTQIRSFRFVLSIIIFPCNCMIWYDVCLVDNACYSPLSSQVHFSLSN